MTIALESMAVAMPEVVGHPNRADFRGVLTVVDMISQRPPSGSRGRRVVLTRKAAEAGLSSLIGMALDYAPSFDRHDVRRKVGVITQAEIVGRNLEIGGYLYAKDFPEIVEEIGKSGSGKDVHSSNLTRDLSRSKSAVVEASSTGGEWLRGVATEPRDWKASLSTAIERILHMSTAAQLSSGDGTGRRALNLQASGGERSVLGMSYEVTDVQLADPRAKVWTLTKVTFTGAAILRRDKAAYPDTWIALVP